MRQKPVRLRSKKLNNINDNARIYGNGRDVRAFFIEEGIFSKGFLI